MLMPIDYNKAIKTEEQNQEKGEQNEADYTGIFKKMVWNV